jgi:hypothetical protein
VRIEDVALEDLAAGQLVKIERLEKAGKLPRHPD